MPAYSPENAEGSCGSREWREARGRELESKRQSNRTEGPSQRPQRPRQGRLPSVSRPVVSGLCSGLGELCGSLVQWLRPFEMLVELWTSPSEMSLCIRPDTLTCPKIQNHTPAKY